MLEMGVVMRTTDGGYNWDQLRSEELALKREEASLRSIDNASSGFNVEMLGLVIPAGKISNRFGPGWWMGVDGFLRKGWVKFGGGFIMAITSTNEKLIAKPGTLHETEPRQVDKVGFFVNLPALMQMTIWERGHFAIRGIMGIGFVHHSFMVSEKHSEILPKNSDYDRNRIGFGTLQTLTFGWVYGRAERGSIRSMIRGSIYLKAGIQEVWTWDVSGKQSDLGRADKTRFGTELWPYVGIGISAYYE